MKLIVIIILFLAVQWVWADEKLGTLRVGSVVYTNVTVMKVTATDVFFTSGTGMGNARLKNLDPTMQKHFHYDAVKAGELEMARTQANAQYRNQLAAQPAVHPPDMSREPEANVPAKAPVGLDIGQKFPGFSENDLNGAPLNVAAHEGKVVLVDFWATWCGPCRKEMPNVISLWQKYRSQGFDVIGVSLDQDKNALVNFTSANGMDWPQFFDGQGWQNKLARQYGVESIPTSFLLDRKGIIIGKGLRGEALRAAVDRALANQ